MLPITPYLSGYINGFLTGMLTTGLLLLTVFLVFEWKRHRSHIAPMRDQRWLDR